ncbi:hypothetical protein DNTS_017178 [Danionella cerebrum]|uniref:DUF3456 domain-containing protein n=1 Tax=Danionella cerebrum TaxID=2873325 RepID=A0A553Q6J5_9TELE|nr:hypothetical protein DNTS_017178 [Danionella translucida]
MESLVILTILLFSLVTANEQERLPNKCEGKKQIITLLLRNIINIFTVCKLLTVELQDALEKSGRSKEVLELGEVLDTGKRRRKIRYNTSETRLTEAMDNICERILQYKVHAERPGSLRYAKGTSQTMSTLKNLVEKGVKVELGVPYELWDEPSVEVSELKRQCETMLEEFEEVVERWYFHHQDERLEGFFCESHVLKDSDKECLNEVWNDDKGMKGSEEAREEMLEINGHDAEEF